jgi:hypothetical protein
MPSMGNRILSFSQPQQVRILEWARKRVRFAPIALFVIALAVRLSIAVATRAYEAPAYGEVTCVAASIANHGTFSNPFNTYTGPTAHLAPVYPYFLALLLGGFHLAPFGPGFSWVVTLLGASGAALMWSLVPACGVRLGLDYRVGMLAGLLGAIYPFRHAVELHGQWEAWCAALAFMGLVIATFRRTDSQPDNQVLAWGALWGAGMLLQPALLPVFIAFVIIGSFRASRLAIAGRHATLALAGMALVIAPWTWRNYHELGGLTFVRDNFGLELSVSNNPRAVPNVQENLIKNTNSDHPDVNQQERRKLAKMGELSYNRMRLHAAVEWIAGNRSRFVELTAMRLIYFWVPQRRWLAVSVLEGLISVTALAGLCTMIWRHERVSWLFAAIWLTYPVVYYVLQADDRYRYPMEWCITLCAAYYVLNLMRIIGPRGEDIAKQEADISVAENSEASIGCEQREIRRPAPAEVTRGSIQMNRSTRSLRVMARKVLPLLQRSAQAGARLAILTTILIQLPCLGANSITVKNIGGDQQSGRPFTIFRVFMQGEIANYPHPGVNGTPLPVWQSNVQTRWPDGSVQGALISFPVDMAKGHLTVDFANDGNACSVGNQAACDGAAPSQSQILGFNSGNWGASIETANQGTNTQAASARTMVQNGDWRFWIKGPVVNIIIVEDRSPALKYDFGWHCTSGCASANARYGTKFFDYSQSSWTIDGANRSLHPVFVLTQFQGWPGVKVEYILENDWITNVQDQSYNLTLKSGQNLATSQFNRNGLVQIARSRWRKTFWDGQTPAAVNVDYNLTYLIASHAIPNYDTTKGVSGLAIDKEIQRWKASDQADIASARPSYGGTLYKGFPDTGGRPDIGLIPEWGVLYLFSMNPVLYQEVMGDAEAMGYAPNHYREAAPNRFFDDLHTTSAFGRTVSADARPAFVSRDNHFSSGADQATVVGGTSNNYWDSTDVAHQPDPMYLAYLLTGDWYLLEEIYFWAAYDLNAATPGDCVWCRHNDWAFINDSLGNTRGTAWTTRNLAHAAWVAPDGTPEKTYFLQKLNYNIAVREGIMNITDGKFARDPRWTWGRNGIALQRPDPLWWLGHNLGAPNSHVAPGKPCFVEAPWQQNYADVAFGHVEELGFSTITPLRQAAAKNLLHMILDPGYAPKDLLANYWLGTRGYAPDCDNAPPLASWTDVIDTIEPTELAAAKTRWAAGATDTTGGYPTIALAASSFLVGINDGNASGIDAWCYMKHHVANQSALSNNPMWAFVPRMTDRDHNNEHKECK